MTQYLYSFSKKNVPFFLNLPGEPKINVRSFRWATLFKDLRLQYLFTETPYILYIIMNYL